MDTVNPLKLRLIKSFGDKAILDMFHGTQAVKSGSNEG